MKIVQVPHRYYPTTGGVETHTAQLASRLVAAGHEVVVVTAEIASAAPEREIHQGVAVRRCRIWFERTDTNLAPGVFAAVRRERPDIVHVQGVHSLVPIFAMLAALSMRRPFVLTFHTGGHDSTARHRMRTLQWRVLAPLIRRAGALIAVSQYEQRLFGRALRMAPEKIALIRNGVTLPERSAAVEKFPQLTLLTIGRLVKYKGHDKAIRAMPSLLSREPDAQLIVVGTGPEAPALRDLAATLGLGDSVKFLHFEQVRRDDLNTTIARSHAVLLLSEYESHPIVVMEALALGTPVITLLNSGFIELAEAGLVTAVDGRATSSEIASTVLSVARSSSEVSLQDGLMTWDEMVLATQGVYAQL